MKKLLICLAIASTMLACKKTAEEVAPADVLGPFNVSVIDENIYRIEDANSDNPAGEVFDKRGERTHFNNSSDMYLFVGDDRALLMNMSNNITWADNAVESLRDIVYSRIGNRPLTITFNNSMHDHMGMLVAFMDDPNVTFELPRTDFELIASKFPKERTTIFDEGATIDLGGMRLKSMMVPGHTHGSTVFFLLGKDMLFSGDAVGMGHGLWLYNREGLEEFTQAIPQLVSYIEDPESGINPDSLVIYGGHYWQHDWLPDSVHLDMQFLRDLQTLTEQLKDGTAQSEPTDLRHGLMDTQFRLNNALIVCNGAMARDFAKKK